MEKIEVKYNGLHTALLRVPGHYGKTEKNDIIKISKEIYEKELKERLNRNGEPEFLLIKKEKPKADKKEDKKE